MHARHRDFRLVRIQFVLDAPILLRNRIHPCHLHGSRRRAKLWKHYLRAQHQIVEDKRRDDHDNNSDQTALEYVGKLTHFNCIVPKGGSMDDARSQSCVQALDPLLAAPDLHWTEGS